MKNTKRKILDKAQEMFNLYGVKETTLRKVALALAMSQGNLNYHFKTKDEIIESLYFELVDKIDEKMQTILQEQPLLSFLYESSYASMECFYEYRFLMKDLYKILSANSVMQKHYTELLKRRAEQYEQLFNLLVQSEIMRAESFENEYNRLYQRLHILGDNWINVAVLFNGNDKKKTVQYYHSLLFEMIYPYLTEHGRAEYEKSITRQLTT